MCVTYLARDAGGRAGNVTECKDKRGSEAVSDIVNDEPERRVVLKYIYPTSIY